MFATWLEKKIQPLFGCVCRACVVKLHYIAALFGVEKLTQSVLYLACPTSIANPPVFRELRLCPDTTSLSAQTGLHGQQPILTSWRVQANWENKFLVKLGDPLGLLSHTREVNDTSLTRFCLFLHFAFMILHLHLHQCILHQSPLPQDTPCVTSALLSFPPCYSLRVDVLYMLNVSALYKAQNRGISELKSTGMVEAKETGFPE